MKISLNCKLDTAGSFGFIKPIADSVLVDSIEVFRDSRSLAYPKIRYQLPLIKTGGITGQFSKFLLMLAKVKPDFDLAIGIYEIPHGLLAFLIGKIKRIPVIISIIGNPGYEKIRKGLWKKLSHYMYQRIAAVTVTGTNSRQFLITNGISPERIYILPNSIDIDYFKPNPIVQKQYDLINLGRLCSEKELDILLYIVSEIKKSIPFIKVGIAGKGPDKNKLELLIKALDLQHNVELLGFVENSADFNNAGKIFVITSSTEGLPRSVIEAMACGVPAIGSNVGDMADIIVDGENGYIINDYHDIDDYTKKISRLLTDKELYESFSDRAIKYSRERFSHQAATRVWEMIFKNIYGDKKLG
ncbi:MAG TPA: glycosyltransferase [bacterium]|nr:glycosyltransferase [bacterium]HPN42136.1 glycosyltransferase [bacterium]